MTVACHRRAAAQRDARERLRQSDGGPGPRDDGRAAGGAVRLETDLASQHVIHGGLISLSEEHAAGTERCVACDGDQIEQLAHGRATKQRVLTQPQHGVNWLQRLTRRNLPGMRWGNVVSAPLAASPIEEHSKQSLRQLDVVRQHRQELVASQRNRDRTIDGADRVPERTAFEHFLERESSGRTEIGWGSAAA